MTPLWMDMDIYCVLIRLYKEEIKKSRTIENCSGIYSFIEPRMLGM